MIGFTAGYTGQIKGKKSLIICVAGFGVNSNQVHRSEFNVVFGGFYYIFFTFLPSSQSTVDCSSLAELNKETLISDRLEEPRGIAVHPFAK